MNDRQRQKATKVKCKFCDQSTTKQSIFVEYNYSSLEEALLLSFARAHSQQNTKLYHWPGETNKFTYTFGTPWLPGYIDLHHQYGISVAVA